MAGEGSFGLSCTAIAEAFAAPSAAAIRATSPGSQPTTAKRLPANCGTTSNGEERFVVANSSASPLAMPPGGGTVELFSAHTPRHWAAARLIHAMRREGCAHAIGFDFEFTHHRGRFHNRPAGRAHFESAANFAHHGCAKFATRALECMRRLRDLMRVTGLQARFHLVQADGEVVLKDADQLRDKIRFARLLVFAKFREHGG